MKKKIVVWNMVLPWKKYRFMLVKYRNFCDVHEQYNSIKGR